MRTVYTVNVVPTLDRLWMLTSLKEDNKGDIVLFQLLEINFPKETFKLHMKKFGSCKII